MSGITGIVNLDGAPIDLRLLEHMTECMAFRGPDLRETWLSDSVGFGHAMLRTTRAGTIDRQPYSLEGTVAVVADCRLDGRATLVADLEAARGHRLVDRTDAELIAHAYLQWGTACVAHLLGDFAFALWDQSRRQLFCARDHLGVKPFYYAHRGGVFLFSNTIESLRRHPAVSDRLDDGAIGDFLLFDRICDTSATAFTDIRRLPAAHTLTLTTKGARIERYWALPVEGTIRYRTPADYTDHFTHLLTQAVSDRLQAEPAGLLLSGGVDSTAVASTAYRLHAIGAAPALRGYTFVYDRLMPDDERHYAGLAARAMSMPIEFWPLDDYTLFERCRDAACRKPEPYHWPLESAALDLYRHISRTTRIVMTGHGGDPLSYFGSLLCTPRFHALLPAAAAYVLSRRRCPPLGLRTTIRRLAGRTPAGSGYPDWLDDTFAARTDLPGRFARANAEPAAVHPTHARAHALLSSAYWPEMFERLDPGATRIPLEFRHPLFDVRLIEYVLRIPLIPWSVDKELLRHVSRGVQPDAVRRRRKSALSDDPLVAHLRNGHPAETDGVTDEGRLAGYVNLQRMRRPLDVTNPERMWIDLRPVSLNLWLQQV